MRQILIVSQLYSFALLKITNLIIKLIIMGNQCPECATTINECKMRDVFKEMPRNRDDLDLSHIKKGQYKKKYQKDQKQFFSMNLGESIIIAEPVKRQEKVTASKQAYQLNSSVLQSIKKPLSFEGGVQTIQLKKGVKYIGGTIQKQPHEQGKVIWEDGTVLNCNFFLGQITDNQKIIIQLSQNCTYEGEVQNCKANGNGKLTLPDGSYFEGKWKDDQPNGIGKHKISDERCYEGSFLAGVKTGKGKYFYQDGVYEGGFLNDQFHGEGILALNDKRIVKGRWRNGYLQGKGQIQWSTGQRYVGNFVQSMRDGQGTYYFADGRQWSGEWSKDLQNGFGSYQIKGSLIKSVWANGLKKQQIRQIELNRA